MSRRYFVLPAIAVLLILGACGSDEEPTKPPPAAAAEPITAPAAEPAAAATPATTVKVDIKEFTHQDVTIAVGQTVEWTNRDSAPHTTSSGTPDASTDVWDSDRLDPGQFFSFTFNEAGTFNYLCNIHPGMTATVTVN